MTVTPPVSPPHPKCLILNLPRINPELDSLAPSVSTILLPQLLWPMAISDTGGNETKPPYLSVEVQKTTGAVHIVEWSKGVNGAINAHGVQT